MDKPKTETQRWVFIGHRESTEGKALDMYIPLSANDGFPTSTTKCYDARKPMRPIGAVYEVEATVDGKQAYLSSAKLIGQLEVRGADRLIAQWKLESGAVDTKLASRRLEKRMKREDLKLLEPLRQTYQSAIGRDRLAMELLILNYIRGGSL